MVAGSRGVAIDGKAQRGRLPFQVGGSPVHALTAFCHEHGVVLAAEPIERGEEKSEAALTVAPARRTRHPPWLSARYKMALSPICARSP